MPRKNYLTPVETANRNITITLLSIPMVNFTVGICSLNFTIIGILYLFELDESGVSTSRSWITVILLINTIPTFLWFSGDISNPNYLKLFAVWSEIGTATVLMSHKIWIDGLYGAMLFSVIGIYFIFFLNLNWLLFHLSFSSTIILSITALPLLQQESGSVIDIIARANICLSAVAFTPFTMKFFWNSMTNQAKEAYLDPLTGLLNRRGLYEITLNNSLFNKFDEFFLATIVVDIDKFKSINDSLGHDAGDTAITTVAERLKILFGEFGYVARVGGDEFVILTIGDSSLLKTKALEIPEKCHFKIGNKLIVTVSVGATIERVEKLPHSDNTIQLIIEAISRSDRAMYAAKSTGGNKALLV